jgi:hypothetical protein
MRLRFLHLKPSIKATIAEIPSSDLIMVAWKPGRVGTIPFQYLTQENPSAGMVLVPTRAGGYQPLAADRERIDDFLPLHSMTQSNSLRISCFHRASATADPFGVGYYKLPADPSSPKFSSCRRIWYLFLNLLFQSPRRFRPDPCAGRILPAAINAL